jgi:hypothetical protein
LVGASARERLGSPVQLSYCRGFLTEERRKMSV